MSIRKERTVKSFLRAILSPLEQSFRQQHHWCAMNLLDIFQRWPCSGELICPLFSSFEHKKLAWFLIRGSHQRINWWLWVPEVHRAYFLRWWNMHNLHCQYIFVAQVYKEGAITSDEPGHSEDLTVWQWQPCAPPHSIGSPLAPFIDLCSCQIR